MEDDEGADGRWVNGANEVVEKHEPSQRVWPKEAKFFHRRRKTCEIFLSIENQMKVENLSNV